MRMRNTCTHDRQWESYPRPYDLSPFTRTLSTQSSVHSRLYNDSLWESNPRPYDLSAFTLSTPSNVPACTEILSQLTKAHSEKK